MIGQKLRRIREFEKITQTQLAETAGVCVRTIRNVERMEKVPIKYVVALNSLLPGLDLLDELKLELYFNKIPIKMARKPREQY